MSLPLASLISFLWTRDIHVSARLRHLEIPPCSTRVRPGCKSLPRTICLVEMVDARQKLNVVYQLQLSPCRLLLGTGHHPEGSSPVHHLPSRYDIQPNSFLDLDPTVDMVMPRKSLHRRIAIALGASVALVTVGLVGSTQLDTRSYVGGNCAQLKIRTTDVDMLPGNATRIPMTKVISHAAGFTVLENAYWRNDTWYFVTEQPWSFPELASVVTSGPWHGSPLYTDDRVVQVISLEQAESYYIQDHIELPGSTVSLYRNAISTSN